MPAHTPTVDTIPLQFLPFAYLPNVSTRTAAVEPLVTESLADADRLLRNPQRLLDGDIDLAGQATSIVLNKLEPKDVFIEVRRVAQDARPDAAARAAGMLAVDAAERRLWPRHRAGVALSTRSRITRHRNDGARRNG